MDFRVVDQRIYALEDALGSEKAHSKAEELKSKAFGAINQLFLLGKKEDVEVTYIERRYQPFWHIAYRTHVEYKRSREYLVSVDSDVKRVTIGEKDYLVAGSKLILPGVEHGVNDLYKEVFIDASDGRICRREKHINAPKREIKETEELMVGDNIVVPAKLKASSITRNILSEMLKPLKADEVTVEEIMIEKLHLYFSPVYAFEYLWKSKKKSSVIEFDAVTFEMNCGGLTLKQKMKELISEADLFDISAEAINLFVPGGGLVVKVAEGVIKRKQS